MSGAATDRPHVGVYRLRAGWHAQIRRAGEVHQQWFPDHSDSAKALRAAVRWRESMERSLPKAAKTARTHVAPGGVFHVQRQRQRLYQRQAHTWFEDAFEARITHAGVRRTRSFGSALHGPERAEELAWQQLAEWIEELTGEPAPPRGKTRSARPKRRVPARA